MATQGERRRQTRTALLDAAAALFAERGVAASSVDAIAEAAGRTSGAVYDHFGSKEGLLFALLEGWVDDVAAVMSAELVTAATLTERIGALWRNVSDPAVGNGRWIALEHELWSYAIRNPAALARLADRYREAWRGLGLLARDEPSEMGPAVMGPAVMGLLLGLEMMRRVDPTAVTDDLAVSALVVLATSEPIHPTEPSRSTT